MKTKLPLLLLGLFTVAAFAQQQVGTFYTYPSVLAIPEVAQAFDDYALVSSQTIDETQTGENIAWNFNDLQFIANTHTQFRPVTTEETTQYPQANYVVETYIDGQEDPTRYILSIDDNMLSDFSLAGADMGSYNLVYTDMGFIGDFPLSYGYTNTDDVAGTFTLETVSGTFTGTATVSVDAYGTLSVNQGMADNLPVARLKAIQLLELSLSGMPIGTVEQTLYQYYSTNGGDMNPNPYFRSINMHLTVPALLIDETTQTYESYIGTTAGVQSFSKSNFAIAPNPVADVLHFEGEAVINSVSITDASGRIVLKSNSSNNIQVSHLSSGIYYVNIEGDNGSQVIKMLKK